MDYQKLFDLMSEHGLTLLEGEMDEIIETVNEIQQPLKEQGERSAGKTVLEMVEDNRPQSDEDVADLMKQYATQVAFQVRDECSKATDIVIMINISDFIK